MSRSPSQKTKLVARNQPDYVFDLPTPIIGRTPAMPRAPAYKVSSFPENSASAKDIPPPVVPYIYTATQTLYPGKSLAGVKCCFCEESTEYALTGEKIVILECSDIAHYECLSQMVDMGQIKPSDELRGMPLCPTCDQVAMPKDNALYHDMIREKLLKQDTSHHLMMAHSTNSLPPPLTPVDQMSVATDPSPSSLPGDRLLLQTPPFKTRGKALPIIEMPNESNDNVFGRKIPASISASSIHVPQRPGGISGSDLLVKEDSLSDPSEIFRSGSAIISRTENTVQMTSTQPRAPPFRSANRSETPVRPNAPTVTIETEVSRVPLANSADQYVSCLVSLSVPNNFYQAQPKYRRTSEDLDNIRKITKRLIQPLYKRSKLDVFSLGLLRIYDNFYVSRDQSAWQETACYLYQDMLILVRDYGGTDKDSDKQGKQLRVKGTVDIQRHLSGVTVGSNGTILTLHLNTSELPQLCLSSQNKFVIDTWRSALLDLSLSFPVRKDHSYEEWLMRQPSMSLAPVRPPIDLVIAFPLTGFTAEDTKFATIRSCIQTILQEMGRYDRMGLVLYSSRAGTSLSIGMGIRAWKDWDIALDKIKPSGSSGTRNDILEAIKATQVLLGSRRHANPVTSVFLINDSGHMPIDKGGFDDAMREFVQNEVCLHTFGVSINHQPDILGRVSAMTCGTYFYAREWSELSSCMLGRYKSETACSHRGVKLSIDPAANITITSVSGVEKSINANVLVDVDNGLPSARPSQSFTPQILRTIQLGNLFCGETRSVLVQVSIPPKTVFSDWKKTILELFSVKMGYSGFGAQSTELAFTGSAMISVSNEEELSDVPLTPLVASFGNLSASSSVYDDGSLITCGEHPPSPLYGDLLMTNDECPMFLAVEKHNMDVVSRRIQLVVARTLENVLVQVINGRSNEARHILDNARSIVRGLLGMAFTSIGDKYEPKFVDTKRMAEVLDKDMSVLAEKALRPVAFSSDVRNWVIQTIGVLRSQMAFTSRSKIEDIFFDKGVHVLTSRGL
jgi:hypothetical protein